MSAHQWRNHAACRGADPDLFHPRPGDMEAVRQAKALCSRCPVTADCLALANAIEHVNGYPVGIYGGRSANQRRKCNDAAGWDRSAPFASLVAALLDAEAEMAGAA